MHTLIDIDTSRITDSDSSHDVFRRAMGFPDFYGRNMDAWIDCMTSLDDPASGMTKVHAPPGGVVVLSLSDATDLAARCSELYEAIVECAAFVNWRRMEMGHEPVLALSYRKK